MEHLLLLKLKQIHVENAYKMLCESIHAFAKHNCKFTTASHFPGHDILPY